MYCLVNCFEGELPRSICLGSTVEVLSLNGLRASKGCRNNFKLPISGIFIFNTIAGTLPLCVFNLRNLSVLHLTGNGLSGKALSFPLPSFSKLENIDLSHNRLSGTINENFLGVPALDLSHNKITGEYSAGVTYVETVSVNLGLNRLSGRLPVSELTTLTAGSLSVLRGNIFSCGSIPPNDEYKNDYICGSEDLNEALYAFTLTCGVYVVCLGVYLLAIRSRFLGKFEAKSLVSSLRSRASRLRSYMSTKLDHVDFDEIQKLLALCNSFDTTMWLFIRIFVLLLLLTSSIYVVRLIDSGTHSYSVYYNTYMWFWTLAYLRGVLPACLILFSWAVTLCVCFYHMILLPRRDKFASSDLHGLIVQPLQSDRITSIRIYSSMWFQKNWLSALAMLVNLCIVVTVNAIYILSTQQGFSSSTLFTIQVSMAVFRLIYSMLCVSFLSKSVTHPVENIYFRLRLLIMNNLLVPCVVTALTSNNCFQELLVAPDAVSTPYSYETCGLAVIGIDGEMNCVYNTNIEVDSAPLVPPFTYNNQCASVILTAYIPVYLLGFSIQMILSCMALYILIRFEKLYHKVSDSARSVVHGILYPNFWLEKYKHKNINDFQINIRSDPYLILDTPSILCFDVINNVIVLLTFGICSPILAFAITSLIVIKMNLWVLLIGRYVSVVTNDDTDGVVNKLVLPERSDQDFMKKSLKQHGHVHFALIALSKTYISFTEVFHQCFWLIFFSSACFIALVCWDCAADEVGRTLSVWIPSLALGYPTCLWLFSSFIAYKQLMRQSEWGSSERETEMSYRAGSTASNPLRASQITRESTV